MFFIFLNQSWGIQTNIFETNIINLAFLISQFFSILKPKIRISDLGICKQQNTSWDFRKKFVINFLFRV